MNTRFDRRQASRLWPHFRETRTAWKPVLLGLAVLLAGASARAQNYSIDWAAVGGGGGTSTGGVYSVVGNIGRPDAGRMSGGNYAIEGGYLSVIAAIQSVSVPPLRIALTTTNTIVVAWVDPSTNFNLVQKSDLNLVSWSTVGTTPIRVGEERQVIIPLPAGNRFYRLQSQ